MKLSIVRGLSPVFLLGLMWLTVEGCRTVATPTFPPTLTPTPTLTLVPTNTFSNTPIYTNTPTLTFTYTYTYTFTNSPTVGSPTNTPTNTLTFTNTFTVTNTPTPTSTNTFTPTCSTTSTPGLIDDFEDNNNQVIVQQCRGGYWFTSNDGAVAGRQTTGGVGLPLPLAATATTQPTPTTEPWTDAASGAGANPGCSTAGSSFALEVSTNDGYTSYQNFGFNFLQPKGPVDATMYTGIEFCGKSGNGTVVVSFMVSDNDPTVQSYAAGPHSAPATLTTSWANFQFPMTTFSAPTSASCVSYPRGVGCNSYGTPTVFQTNALMSLGWQPPNATMTDVFLDNISFY